MSRVLVPLAAGFEEIECSTIVDILRRAGVEVVLAGLQGDGATVGSRGMLFSPDLAFEKAQGPWDLVVLPGGAGGAENMMAHDGIKKLLAQRASSGELLAAICAAPQLLDAVGALQEGGYTCYPGWEQKLRTGGRRQERVVDSGTVITSQGPGTAMEFALYLVGRLCGEETRNSVAEGLLHG